MAPAAVWAAVRVPEEFVDEVAPRDVPDLLTDLFELRPKTVKEARHGIFDEREKITARVTRRLKLSVVALSGPVVVVAQQVGRGGGHPCPEQEEELDESCRAPVAVSERMNPSEVDVRSNRLEDGVGDLMLRGAFEGGAFNPFTEPRGEMRTVFWRRPAVPKNAN